MAKPPQPPKIPPSSSAAVARTGPVGGGARVALLLGWLGCRPELGHLRAYERLYRKLGWDAVLSFVAPPSAVVDSTVVSPATVTASSESSSEASGVDNLRSAKKASAGWRWNRVQMEQLATRVVRETADAVAAESSRHRSGSSGGGASLVIHSFSNGGCFLYEEVRRQVMLRGDWSLCGIPLVGVVFDSCPAWYDPAQDNYWGATGGLGRAMSFCTKEEQERFADRLERIRRMTEETSGGGLGLAADADHLRSKRLEMESSRRDEFWHGMRDDPCRVPQLYIYSENDELTPCDPLRRLVRCRKERFGNDNVVELVFEDSPHCRHLRTHPEEYGTALESFLRLCLDERDKRSGGGHHRSSL